PDLFVVSRDAGMPPREWRDVGIPLLVIEVLSPSTARYDRVVKRLRFQRSGVPAYWIVDLDARIVEAWTPDAERPVIATESLRWQPDETMPELRVDLEAYFVAVFGEAESDAS